MKSLRTTVFQTYSEWLFQKKKKKIFSSKILKSSKNLGELLCFFLRACTVLIQAVLNWIQIDAVSPTEKQNTLYSSYLQLMHSQGS